MKNRSFISEKRTIRFGKNNGEHMTRKTFLALAIALFAVSVEAKELKGVTFDDETTVGTTKLKLNGLGARKAYGLFEVYIGGLYVAEPSKDADVIVKSSTPKKIVLKFKRSIDKDKMKEAFESGFMKNAGKEYKYRPDLIKLNAEMSNMNDKDEMKFTIYSDKAEIQVKEKPVVTLASADFSKTLLKVFIGDPPDDDLKNGLLGK
jgi:hypothetical protein